ncbi:MAG: hypothetical protein M3505_05655 [Verrucomicrobiota bacterium]|nr:hypothetical protein [Verrucomicrobiota bacterium]
MIDSGSDNLFNPRLTLFLDVQLGPAVYFFGQARFDRHFDPTDFGAQVRFDEYAVRMTHWEDGRLSLQAGKFATVIGRWVERHLSWDNPFLNAPLVYENITAIEDRARRNTNLRHSFLPPRAGISSSSATCRMEAEEKFCGATMHGESTLRSRIASRRILS